MPPNGASLRLRRFARQCQCQFISLLVVGRLVTCGLPRQTNDARDAVVRVRNSYSRSVIKCVYGSVPRAVASVLHAESRSQPLAVLIRRAFPYTQSQTAVVGRGGAMSISRSNWRYSPPAQVAQLVWACASESRRRGIWRYLHGRRGLLSLWPAYCIHRPASV